MSEEEFREFVRQQTLRHERASRRMDRWLETVDRRVEEIIERTEILRAESEVQIAELRNRREEHQQEARAQRKALFAILDRLADGPTPAAG